MSTPSSPLLPKLPGVDVSSYQGSIDWPMLAPHIKFAFIKATDGARIIDSQLANNVHGATDNGVPFGFYHFFRNGDHAESDHFLEIFEKYPSQLPPVLDLELSPLSTPNALDFLEAVNVYTRPMVYTSPSFADTYLTSDFAGYPLWIAHYTLAPEPDLARWKTWDFWQWCISDKTPGIPDAVDLDWCLDEPTLASLMRSPT